jgi:hypothetical protein
MLGTREVLRERSCAKEIQQRSPAEKSSDRGPAKEAQREWCVRDLASELPNDDVERCGIDLESLHGLQRQTQNSQKGNDQAENSCVAVVCRASSHPASA